MPKGLVEILPDDPADHRAFKAWRQLCPNEFEPDRIEILKLKTKSAVYRLSRAGKERSTVVAKRCPTATASLERLLYQEFLPLLPVPTLRCFGYLLEPEGASAWIFMEDAGMSKYSPADADHRVLAGRWLGALHSVAPPEALEAALPERGPSHYRRLLRESVVRLREYFDSPGLPAQQIAILRKIVGHCEVIEMHWAELEDFCQALPRRLVHGDFVIKNLRLASGAAGPTLLVYDFEMAGWGVPATDLAQFIGKCVSPDLDAYRAVLAQDRDGSNLDMPTLRRLAAYGNILRLVDKVYWEAGSLLGHTFDFLIRPVATMALYEPQLTDSLRAVEWNHQ